VPRTTLQVLISLIVVGTMTILQTASPAIGVVMGKGSFRLDSATVSGNGTLFEGTTVETGATASDLQLQGGIQIGLASESRGKVYRNRLVLEKGEGWLENAANYRVEARSLCVLPAEPSSKARVMLNGGNRIQVAALNGAVRVTNGTGMVVANIAPGKALEFEPQAAGAAAPSVMTGTLEKKDGHFVLTDETAAVTAELQGPGLDKYVGGCVEITGALVPSAQPVTGATQVIRVSKVKRCSKPAAAAAAGGAAGAAGAGMAVATKAVIVGIVVAGAATGTAVALTRGEEVKPSLSR
jgi:hypothetical protein